MSDEVRVTMPQGDFNLCAREYRSSDWRVERRCEACEDWSAEQHRDNLCGKCDDEDWVMEDTG